VQVQLEVAATSMAPPELEAVAVWMEREAKRRRVHVVPGPPVGAKGGGLGTAARGAVCRPLRRRRRVAPLPSCQCPVQHLFHVLRGLGTVPKPGEVRH
jgi:hypothetical protein